MFKREGKWYALVSESCCYCKPGGKVHAYSATDPLGPYDYLGEIGKEDKKASLSPSKQPVIQARMAVRLSRRLL